MPVADIEACRKAALARGNELRARRAGLKRELKDGDVLLSDALLSEEGWLSGMRVREILLATPGIGKKKADRALRNCWVSQTARLGRTSIKARERLLEQLLAGQTKIVIAPSGWEAAA